MSRVENYNLCRQLCKYQSHPFQPVLKEIQRNRNTRLASEVVDTNKIPKMDGLMDARGRTDRRMDGWIDGWVDGRMDGWTDGRELN